jgi:hypothetical protein
MKKNVTTIMREREAKSALLFFAFYLAPTAFE